MFGSDKPGNNPVYHVFDSHAVPGWMLREGAALQPASAIRALQICPRLLEKEASLSNENDYSFCSYLAQSRSRRSRIRIYKSKRSQNPHKAASVLALTGI